MINESEVELSLESLRGKDLEDMRSALTTIRRRSEGLLQFLESYRSLSRVPKPSFQIVPVEELFNRTRQLAESRADAKRVDFSCSVEPAELEITADPNLIEQVLINLINNSLQSLRNTKNGRIELHGLLQKDGKIVLRVVDNGPGISPHLIDEIFIPFFTTNADGNGIGLSLSRQIMRVHNGDLDVISDPGKQTTFSLRF
jgi:signal transduction histidine kinase